MKFNLLASQPAAPSPDFSHLFQTQKPIPPKYTLQQVGEMTQGLLEAFTHEATTRGYERTRAIELKNAKAKEFLERNNFMSMVHDFQGVAGAVAAFASPERANQINIISSHFVNIGIQVAGLAGYGPLAGEGGVTPIGFGSTILTAIGQISSLFRKQSGVTFESAVMDAIGVLSQQINQLRDEMHRRFDDVQFQLFMMNSDIIIQFSLLHKEVGHLDQKLDQIHAAIVSNHSQLQHTLSSISQSISDLGKDFADRTTRDEVSKLTDLISPVLYNINDGHMTDEEFSKLSGQLLAAIGTNIKRQDLAGALSNLPDGEIVKWRPIKHSVQWASYQVNAVRAYAAATTRSPLGREVGNPLLLCYATLTLILINRGRYSTSSDELAQHISKVELEKIAEVITEINTLKESLIPLRAPDLYAALLRQIKISVGDFKKAYEEAINAFETKKEGEFQLDTEKAKTKQQLIDIQRFNAQEIEPGCQGPNWFVSRRHVCGEGYESNPTAYTDSLQARTTYVKTIKDDMAAHAKKYQAQNAQIIYPAEGYQGPLLPLSLEIVERIIKRLPNKTQHALELNTLQLQFRYFTKDNREFHLQALIDGHVCYEVNLPYEMPLYQPGAEWLFWVGGLSPTGEVVEHGIRQGVLQPKKKKYDYWDNVFKPTLKTREGYLERFKPEEQPNIASRLEIDAIETKANAHNIAVYQTLREQFNASVQPQVESDCKSKLGKAITAFDANFKRLKALLALAFPDTHSPSHVLYRLIYENNIALSRQDFLLYLEENPSQLGNELFGKLEKFILELERHLPSLVDSLRSTASHQLLDSVLAELEHLIDEYRPSAVECNQIAPRRRGVQTHDALREKDLEIAQLKAKLTAVSRTVNGLPTDLGKAFKEETLGHLEDIVNEHPHLMGNEAMRAPVSTAQRIATSGGSPVFGVHRDGASSRLSLPAPDDNPLVRKAF